MNILALDTSADACSVALALDGEVFARFEHAPRRHTELILPMIESVLAEAGVGIQSLDALAFGRGPGSFTGLRIAAGVAQGIAFAADLPVVPVSTLAALAQRCFLETGQRWILTAFDARMGEVYWAAYEIDSEGLARLSLPEAVLSPDQAGCPAGKGWFGAGSGWAQYGEILQQCTGVRAQDTAPELVCRAKEMLLLAQRDLVDGNVVSAEQALPVYLRDRVAWKKVSSAI